MIDLVYVLQVHKNPLQLKRLISKLYSEHTYFYIHVDKKSDEKFFRLILEEESEKLQNIVFVTDRVNCIWGDFSQVIASLNLIKAVLEKHTNGFCILMSGQDYPIKTNQHIRAFFEKRQDMNFINVLPAAETLSPRLYVERLQHYLYNFSENRGDFKIFTQGTEADKYYKEGKIPKDFYQKLSEPRIPPFDIYKGSSWWAFNLTTLQKVFNYINKNKQILFEYFKYSSCSDELFFQSIIKELSRNDASIQIRSSVTFVDWSRKVGPLPAVFESKDLYQLLSLNETQLFARKFDLPQSESLLDLLDKHIINE